ncbi:MAG: glycosyltransferase family 2 protein [Sediminibacterium sp.]
MNNYVFITTIVDPNRTIDLAKKYLLDEDIKEVWIYDNGHQEKDKDLLLSFANDTNKVIYCDTRGLSLHGQWNKALKFSLDNHPCNIVLSNDDLDIEEKLVSKLSSVLNSSDEYWIAYPANKQQYNNGAIKITSGTKADGGMDGSCFMIKSEAFKSGMPFVDERFVYWGGDDDIARNVEKMGKKQVRVNNTWSDHMNENTSSRPEFKWMQDAKENDRILLKEKWGISR